MGWGVSFMPQPCSTPAKRTPSTHWIGGWVGLRAGLDTEARGNILLPLLEIEPRSPSLYSDTILTELPWLHFTEGIQTKMQLLFVTCPIYMFQSPHTSWFDQPNHKICIARTKVTQWIGMVLLQVVLSIKVYSLLTWSFCLWRHGSCKRLPTFRSNVPSAWRWQWYDRNYGNVGNDIQNHTASQYRTANSPTPWYHQISENLSTVDIRSDMELKIIRKTVSI
jgi:hypothetical protein